MIETGEACLNGDKYAPHLVDQYSGYHILETLRQRNKASLSAWLSRSIYWIIRQFDCDVIAIRSDNERGYRTYLEEMTKHLGIRLEYTVVDTPSQNGGAEVAGGSLSARARALRLHANLPEELAHEMYRSAAYILNQTPAARLDWKTPYEVA